MKLGKIKLLIVGSVLGLMVNSVNAESMKNDKVYFKMNGKGELMRPVGYRSWIYVGTPVTPNELNGGKAAFPEMHNVYIDPVSYKYYMEHGKWRDGTILVKELVSVGDKSATSGKGYFEGEFQGLEAVIKSSKYSPKQPGNWSYYSFTSPKTGILKSAVDRFPAAACNSCHENAAADDFVFTQYYPVLRAAKGVGKGVVPENTAKRTPVKMQKK